MPKLQVWQPHNSIRHLVITAQLPSAQNKQVVWIIHDQQAPRIRTLLRRLMHDPRILITRLGIDEDLRVARSTHNNSPILPPRRAPNNVRRPRRHDATRVNHHLLRLIEFPRVRSNLIVHGEPPAVSGIIAAAKLIQHEVIAVAQARDGRHPRAIIVRSRRGIIDRRAPVHEIRSDLMRQLLAVFRVPLIGVVGDELVLVDEEEGFPDGRLAVVGDAAAAGGDAGDEGPGLAGVAGGVDVDLGFAEVGGEGVAGAEDGAFFEGADGAGEDVEEGLVAEAPAVYGVFDGGKWGPGLAFVGAFVDGVVDNWWLGRVVFPGAC